MTQLELCPPPPCSTYFRWPNLTLEGPRWCPGPSPFHCKLVDLLWGKLVATVLAPWAFLSHLNNQSVVHKGLRQGSWLCFPTGKLFVLGLWPLRIIFRVKVFAPSPCTPLLVPEAGYCMGMEVATWKRRYRLLLIYLAVSISDVKFTCMMLIYLHGNLGNFRPPGWCLLYTPLWKHTSPWGLIWVLK